MNKKDLKKIKYKIGDLVVYCDIKLVYKQGIIKNVYSKTGVGAWTYEINNDVVRYYDIIGKI